VDRVVAKAASAAERCRGIALSGAARTSRGPFEAAVTDVLAAAAAHANAAIVKKYRRRTDTLRWRDRVTTERVDSSALAIDEQASLTSPQLCVVAHEWAAARFRGVPRQLQAFASRFEAVSKRGMLAPSIVEAYVDAGDSRTLIEIRNLEEAAGSKIGPMLLDARARLVHALGLGSRPRFVVQREHSAERS
jgi:hypothetical protein